MFGDFSQPFVKVEEDEQLVLNSVFEPFGGMPDLGVEHQPVPHTHADHISPPGDGAVGDEPSASKRKRPHNGKACVNCRRRKARCQGGPPACRTCLLYNDQCSWDDFGDGRRPASRTYVQALKTRIRSLEEEVKTLRGDSTDDAAELAGTGAESASGSSPGGAEVQQVANTMLHLQMSDAGEERVFCFGPTSAFAHSSPILTPSEVSPSIDSLVNAPAHQVGDWRRYLPPTPYLTATQHNAILARFFKYFAAWGLRVHPRNFYTDMHDHLVHLPYSPLPRWSQYSPFLHNIILAFALIWADEPELRTPAVRVQFGKRADEFLKVELSRPLLATCQGLSVKSSYHSIDGDPTAGWAYFGMADRVAQTLGLNVDCTPHEGSMMTASEVQRRTEMFWSTFVAEQSWSVYTGRPPTMPEHTTPPPSIDPELDSMPFTFDRVPGTSFELTPSGRNLPMNLAGQSASPPPAETVPKPQDSLVSTTFVEQSKLALIQQKVLNKLYGIRAPTARVQKEGVVSALALELDTWVEALPTNLNINGHSNRNSLPHVIMLQLARESLTIFIYRPCYRLSSTSDSDPASTTSVEAVRRCDRSAARIITLLGLYHQRFLLKYSPPNLFTIAFTAGTTFLLSAMHHPSAHMKMAALVNADKCVQYLRLSGDSWRAARRKADILQDLVNKYASPASTSIIAISGLGIGEAGRTERSSREASESRSRLVGGDTARPSSWQYSSPMPMPQALAQRQGRPESMSMSTPAMLSNSTSAGTKRRRDTFLSDVTDSTGGSGDLHWPPLTPILPMPVGDETGNDGYDSNQWDQLLAQVGGVFDPPEMGPPPWPSQLQIGGGRVSQYEYVPFQVPVQSAGIATSLPSVSTGDNSFLHHHNHRSTGQNPSVISQSASISMINNYGSPYTVPLPRGTSAQAVQPPALVPSYMTPTLTSGLHPLMPASYIPRAPTRPNIDTNLVGTPISGQPYTSYISPAESQATTYFPPQPHPISPESMPQGSGAGLWQTMSCSTNTAGTDSAASVPFQTPATLVHSWSGDGVSRAGNACDGDGVKVEANAASATSSHSSGRALADTAGDVMSGWASSAVQGE